MILVYMKKLLISSLILLALDSFFIYFISRTFTSQIFDVQRSPLHINIVGAVLCYIFLIFGLNYFILQKRRSVFDAFLLGIVIYGVYETTSLALLRNWRLTTVFIDTLWGGILFGLTTYLTYLL
jgi:uncharacterized membrane protein